MGSLRRFWENPDWMRWVVAAVCFALGLVAGWFSADFWLDRWTGA